MIKITIEGNTLQEVEMKLIESADHLLRRSSVLSVPSKDEKTETNVETPVSPVSEPTFTRGRKKPAPPVEVKEEPVVAPLVIPPMPTADIKVSIPSLPKDEAPIMSAPAPIIAPSPSNGYTIDTFKSNLVMVLFNLIAAKKIDRSWVDTTKAQFNNKEIFNWSEETESMKILFDSFVSWGFIQEIKA